MAPSASTCWTSSAPTTLVGSARAAGACICLWVDVTPMSGHGHWFVYSMVSRDGAERGLHQLRLVAEMDWLLAVPPSRRELAALELLLDEAVTEVGAARVVWATLRLEHAGSAARPPAAGP